MNIFYKVEGTRVDRSVFEGMLPNPQVFSAWENVIEENREVIETGSAAIVFKISDKNFHVLTDTELLFKLSYEVKRQIHTAQSKQKVAQLI